MVTKDKKKGIDREIRLNELIRYFMNYLPLFLVCLLVGVVCGYFVNSYSTPTYRVAASVLAEDQAKGINPEELLFGMDGYLNKEGVANQMIVLHSFPLIQKTIQNLNLNTSYWRKGTIRDQGIYVRAPFKVFTDSAYPMPENNLVFEIQFTDENHFDLKAEGNLFRPLRSWEIEGNYRYNDWIEKGDLRFKITPTDRHVFDQTDHDYFFLIHNLNKLSYSYKSRLKISKKDAESSIISLMLEGAIPQRDIDFLNTLIQLFINENLIDKNRIATSTIDFINRELELIRDSLQLVEVQLERFKSNNQFSDIGKEGELLLSQVTGLENEKAHLVVREKYYEYLEESLKENEGLDKLMSPSSFGIEDAILNKLTMDLVSLQLEKNVIVDDGTMKSPLLKQINSKISSINATLAENVKNLKASNDILLKNVENRISAIEGTARELPGFERQLFSIERMYNLSESLYLLLMEKKAEAEITRSSNTADMKIVEPAMRTQQAPIYPIAILNIGIGLLCGFLAPALFLSIRLLMNNKVQDKEDLDVMGDIPYLGSVRYAPIKKIQYILDYPKSSIAESFRTIRSNLSFFKKGEGSKVFVLTSSISGEGKTFCTGNLAVVFAIGGKKTLLIDGDIRKPKLHKILEKENVPGLTSYLIGKHDIDSLVQSSGIENLDFIASGPIPPNPAEILMNGDKMKGMFEELKEKYDYILIDTSPIGLVTDPLLFNEYADFCIMVVRNNFTQLEAVSTLAEWIEEGKIKNPALIYNNAKEMQSGYGYSRSDAYYEVSPENNNWLRRIFRK